MAYATSTDMVTTFGERECISLTDHNRNGVIDDTVMDNALVRASAEIDGYLVGRYATPWPDTPRILVGRCCDIARYQLASAERILTDEIKLRYDDAIRFLEQVANGKINLGRTDTGAVIQGSSQIAIHSGVRQFGRESTRGGAF